MDIQTKKIILYVFTLAVILIIAQELYKTIFTNQSITGSIVLSLCALFGYSMVYLTLTHDINKFERWKKEALEFTVETVGKVTDLSLSSTRENGRNTVILSVTYNDFELTFSGIHPEFQFKYRIDDEIKILVNKEDSQRFVLFDLK